MMLHSVRDRAGVVWHFLDLVVLWLFSMGGQGLHLCINRYGECKSLLNDPLLAFAC